MSSPTFDSLRETLKNLRRRRSNLFILKQVSYFVIAFSVLILSLSAATLWLEPDKTGTTILFAVSVLSIALLIWRLIQVLGRQTTDDRRLAHYVEDHIPDLEQRLLTSLEFTEEDLANGKRGVSQQFIQQLWLDAQEHVQIQQEQVETVAPARTSYLSLASAAGVAVVVMGLFLSSDVLFNAASRLAWPFAISEPVVVVEVLPDIEISVEPGDLEMQRGDSVTIIARVRNAIPGTINLRLQDDNVNWRDATMNRDGSGSDNATYSYFIPSLAEDTTYYVTFDERGEQSSAQYQIDLFDLPQIEKIDLAMDYPEYTEIEDITEEDSGDLVVPQGTEVELLVTFNKNIRAAVVEFDESYSADEDEINPLPPYEDISLVMDGNIGRAKFTVNQDGVYRISATDFSDLQSKNPLDYFIRSIEDTPPELALVRPGQDQDVMPLEEVVLEIDASDDYGLSKFTLNYSVVGADEVQVDFLPEQNLREVSGDELIYLEDLGVEPGDFVSYFLTLADNNGLEGPVEVISDIYFLQVIPTDQEFRQSGGGGGGGESADSSALVQIQKDIIAATWKLKNRQANVSPEEFASDAEIIAESQLEATQRTRRSIDRLAERVSFSDASYDAAVENLSLAIDQMNQAADELGKEQITSALQPEQLALQYVLKAEANINRTNISMQQGGGGGGAAQQEREDLRELFEMEMGQLENRYETPNSAGGGGDSQQQTEEANKLEELARRQEGLTRAQRNLARREEQMSEEQKRRELERLMRQQEQLSREVAQLAEQLNRDQQSPPSQQQNPQASSQSQSQSSSSSPSSGSSSGGQQQQPQTALERAAQQMQEASQSETAAIAAARSQKALENLREQQRELSQQSERSVNQLAKNLGQRGQQLLQQQRDLQESLQESIREQGLGQTRQSVRDDGDLQELIEAQQQQQKDLEEIEDMLRAIIARGDNEDQRLMSQAQAASRELRPIREEMQTSNRVLRNGMVNLSVDIEQELEGSIEDFVQSLAALNPSSSDSASDQVQQAASDAAQLRQQIEDLEQQALAFNEAGQEAGGDVPSLREMREQLEQTQQLAQQLTQQLQDQARAGGNQPGQRGQLGQQRGQQGQQGEPGQQGQQGQQGQAAGGGSEQQPGSGGRVGAQGTPNNIGNARSIRQQLAQQDIEDFLNQPELFRQLLQPITELEGALRAQAELDNINNKLYATVDEDIPDEYRDLVEEYYRVLSENQGSSNTDQ